MHEMFFEQLVPAIASAGTIIALLTLAYQVYRNRCEDKRRQATNVSAWVMPDKQTDRYEDTIYYDTIIISNASREPIYDVVTSVDLVDEKSAEEQTDEMYIYYIQCIPPGEYMVKAESMGNGMCKQFNASVCFRDVQGNSWYRNAGGILTEIDNSIDFRHLSRPVLSEPIFKYKPL